MDEIGTINHENVHMVKIWDWLLKRTAKEEMLEIKHMEMISIEGERCKRGNWKDVNITGTSGILRSIFLDGYMRYEPIHENGVRKALTQDVRVSPTRQDCVALEHSKLHDGYEHDDSEELLKKMGEIKIVHDSANYLKSDSALTLEGDEYEMRELLKNLCKQKSFSNYAMEAFVFLMMHCENKNHERIIPLDGLMHGESDITVTIAKARFQQKAMDIDIIENCSLRSLSDYHIYEFFLMRNMYIPVSMHGDMLFCNKTWLMAEPEDIPMLKKYCKPIEILNIAMLNDALKCLTLWYIPFFSYKTKIEINKNTLFWVDLKEIDDWRVVLSYFKTRAPHIRTADNEILKKNFVGLYEPTMTEEEMFYQSNDWISFKQIDFSNDQLEIKKRMKNFIITDTDSKRIYNNYISVDHLYFKKLFSTIADEPTENVLPEKPTEGVEVRDTVGAARSGPADEEKQNASASKKRKMEDSQMATRHLKKRKGEDLNELKEDLKFAMSEL